MRRRALQRIMNPFDMITGIFLEIRIPRNLLGEDDLAIDQSRRLSIAATEVEADTVSLKVTAHRQTGLRCSRKTIEGRCGQRERASKNLLAHELVIERSRARRTVDLRKCCRDFVCTGDEHLA